MVFLCIKWLILSFLQFLGVTTLSGRFVERSQKTGS
jgi:hypothetical protein